METNTKNSISEALKKYAEDNSLSQEQLSQITGLNVSYINAILNKEYKVGKTNIKESLFKRIADLVGIKLEKDYLKHVDTLQYNQIYSELLDAKVTGRVKIIISKSGFGKTYTVSQFLKHQPSNSHKITLSSLYKLPDVLNELCEIFNVDLSRAYSNHTRLKNVATKIRAKKENGALPIIIFDEAENAAVPTLRMLKAFYDLVHEHCSIVLIGTPELLRKLDRMRDKDVEGMSQFYRRFKAGIREFTLINKEKHFAPFLENIEDKNLRILLTTLSDNYGELTDYIGHSLREADRMGLPLTEQLFRHLFGLDSE